MQAVAVLWSWLSMHMHHRETVMHLASSSITLKVLYDKLLE